MNLKILPGMHRGIKTTLQKARYRTLQALHQTRAAGNRLKRNLKGAASAVSDDVIKPCCGAVAQGAITAQTAASSQVGQLLETLFANAINTPNTTVYDKAIDAVYLSAGTGGSRLHHLVDGQHDLFGAFMAARGAKADDSVVQELFGTAAHLSKDLFSKMGLPVFSIDASAYKSGSEWIENTLGISKEWQADFLQINGLELFAGMLSATCVVFGVKKADASALLEMGVSSGLASMVSANPISMASACVALVLTWQRRKKMRGAQAAETALVAAGGSAATLLAGTALAGFAALGAVPLAISFLLTLVVGIAARQLIARNARTFRNPKLALALWKSHLHRILPQSAF